MRVTWTRDCAIVVAVFGHRAFLDPYDIGRDKRRGASIAQEGPVNDHVIAFRRDRSEG